MAGKMQSSTGSYDNKWFVRCVKKIVVGVNVIAMTIVTLPTSDLSNNSVTVITHLSYVLIWCRLSRSVYLFLCMVWELGHLKSRFAVKDLE